MERITRRKMLTPVAVALTTVACIPGRADNRPASIVSLPPAVLDAKSLAASMPGMVNEVWNEDVSRISSGLNPVVLFTSEDNFAPIAPKYNVDVWASSPNILVEHGPRRIRRTEKTIDRVRLSFNVIPSFPTLDAEIRKLLVEHAAWQVAVWDVANYVAWQMQLRDGYRISPYNGKVTDAQIARTVGMHEGLGSAEFLNLQTRGAVLPMMTRISHIYASGTDIQKSQLMNKTYIGLAFEQAAKLNLDVGALQNPNSAYFKETAFGSGPWADWARQGLRPNIRQQ